MRVLVVPILFIKNKYISESVLSHTTLSLLSCFAFITGNFCMTQMQRGDKASVQTKLASAYQDAYYMTLRRHSLASDIKDYPVCA